MNNSSGNECGIEYEGLHALYLGRFQIFHKGHLHIIKFIDQQPDTGKITIGIGSPQYSRFNKHPELPLVMNPFTEEERRLMLEMSLEGELKNPYEIVSIKDMHNCKLWLELIDKIIYPDVYYTNSKKEAELFEAAGIETRRFPIKDKYHAQYCREAIADRNREVYEQILAPGTLRFVDKFGIEDLLAEFFRNNLESLAQVHEMQRKDGTKMYVREKKYNAEII